MTAGVSATVGLVDVDGIASVWVGCEQHPGRLAEQHTIEDGGTPRCPECVADTATVPVPAGGRARRRSRAGVVQFGRCVACHHRTWRRHLGVWCHTSCVLGTAPTGTVLDSVPDGAVVEVTGVVACVIPAVAPSGRRWARVTLASHVGPVALAVYPATYEHTAHLLTARWVTVHVTGFCDRRGSTPRLVARSITAVTPLVVAA